MERIGSCTNKNKNKTLQPHIAFLRLDKYGCPPELNKGGVLRRTKRVSLISKFDFGLKSFNLYIDWHKLGCKGLKIVESLIFVLDLQFVHLYLGVRASLPYKNYKKRVQ